MNCSTMEEKQQTAGRIKRKSLKFVPEFKNSEIYHLLEKGEKKPTWKRLIHMFSIAEVMGKVGSGWETGDVTVAVTNVTSGLPVTCQHLDCLSNCRGATNQKIKSTLLHQRRSQQSLFKFAAHFPRRCMAAASRHAIRERYTKQKTFHISMWLFYSWQRALKGFLMINNKGDM